MTTKFPRALAIVFFAAALSVRAAPPPAEALLPADTLLLVTAPDFAAVRAAARQSAGWRFWNDPAMKPFRDKFMARWDEVFVAPLERDLGVKFDDYASLPQGQLTLAVTRNGWNGSDHSPPPGVILLLDARDRGGLLKTNLDALRQQWTAAGKPIHTETIRGVAFSVVTLSSNNLPALAGLWPRRPPVRELGKEPTPEKPAELVVGQAGSLLIAGDSVKAVEPIVAHLTGGAAPALKENAGFAADQLAQFRAAPLYYAWFNAKTFFDVLARTPPEPPNPKAPAFLPALSLTAMLNASGLMGLKSVSLAGRESSEGSQLNVYLSAPEAARQGLLTIMAAVPKDAHPPAFVPASVVKFSRWRIDGRKSWDELQKMLDSLSPAGLAGLDATIDAINALARQKDPDFDLRKSLIANLGDDFISYQKAPGGNTPADLSSAPSLFLFAVVDADRTVLVFKNAVSLMYGRQDAPEPRDFLGRKIYTIPLPGRRAPGAAAPVARSLYCAASGGYIAVTSDSAALEEYLRSNTGQVRPLRETTGLAEAAQRVGGAGNGLFGYQNQLKDARSKLALLKLAPSRQIEGLSLVTGLDEFVTGLLLQIPPVRDLCNGMDFSRLPDYDQVAKYFYYSVSGGGATADGLSFQMFAPRPPQMN